MSKVGSGVGSKPDSIRTAGSRHPVQTPSRNDPTGTAIHKWPLEPSQRDQNRWPWSYEKLRPPTTQDSLPPRPLALSTPNRLKAGAVTEPRHSLLGNRSHRSGCCPDVSTPRPSGTGLRNEDTRPSIHWALVRQAVCWAFYLTWTPQRPLRYTPRCLTTICSWGKWGGERLSDTQGHTLVGGAGTSSSAVLTREHPLTATRHRRSAWAGRLRSPTFLY